MKKTAVQFKRLVQTTFLVCLLPFLILLISHQLNDENQ
jgi:hypothetical protein